MQLTLNPDQQHALDTLLAWIKQPTGTHITLGGYAGTGKTTLIGELRKKLPTEFKVAFCCFTGKATAVLQEKLQQTRALRRKDRCGTIHSLIYTSRTDERGEIVGWDRVRELDYDLIIVDEGSMVSSSIWRDIVAFRVPIIVVGDHGQLPPIDGEFNLMEKPDLRLEKIVRQAEGNPIIRLSARVRTGFDIPFGNFGAVKKFNTQDETAWEVFESLVSSSQRDVLCICARNSTRNQLNQRIRMLRGFESQQPTRGDRVICLRNNHSKRIFNGMLGTVKFIESSGDEWYDTEITFDSTSTPFTGRALKAQFGAPTTTRTLPPTKPGEGGDLFDFGYALTAHKAQGSEAEVVIVFEERLSAYSDDMWNRWLYTAITRSRSELYLFAAK